MDTGVRSRPFQPFPDRFGSPVWDEKAPLLDQLEALLARMPEARDERTQSASSAAGARSP